MSGGKRLILCCDGTWMDSDDGFTKPSLIPYVPTGTLQIPSNVTRISRALNKVGPDGKPQIIYYHSGVGTGSSMVDTITGGLLGKGISENIREAYSFIAANYTPGDEIILIGFSRGAFTVRSVASLIRDIGLLTRSGMDSFYPIFKDQENFRNDNYRDIFPNVPFSRKPHGPGAAIEYKRRLERGDLTRVYDADGNKIVVKAVAVWDTVGSLGIPNIAFLSKIGLPHSTKEYRFYDTSLSGIIRHAFQALALDEHRAPFSPAVWERKDMDHCTVDLRQVWFPGAHSNIGGGYPDQEIANISLAWMMDQLASIGVSFHAGFIDHIYTQNISYYTNPPYKPRTLSSLLRRPDQQWAVTPIYEKHRPIRPFGLGQIIESKTGIWNVAGKAIRTPGLYKRADPDTGVPTQIPMAHTNERIHSCVRIRLELEGLGQDDLGLYKCSALYKSGPWRLRRVRLKVKDPIPWDATWGPDTPAAISRPDDMRWVWEYDGPEEDAPRETIMVEENLGPFQRQLLKLNSAREVEKHRKRRRRKPQDDRDSFVDSDVPIVREKPRRRHRQETIIVEGPEREERIIVEEKHERRHQQETIIVEGPEREEMIIVEEEIPPERYRETEEMIIVEEEIPPKRYRERASSRYREDYREERRNGYRDDRDRHHNSDRERDRETLVSNGSRYRDKNSRY